MNSSNDAHENTEKQDDSDAQTDGLDQETSDESSSDEPVVIEGEAREVDEIDENSEGSDEESESFPLEEDVAEDVVDEVEEVAEEAVAAAPSPEPKRASAMPMIFGGLVAGGIGFASAYFLPDLNGEADQITGVTELVETNSSSLASLTTRIEEIGESIPPATDTSALESSLSGLESGLSGFETNVVDVQNSVAAVETLVSDLTAEVEALKNVPPVDLSGLSADLSALGERITALEIEEGDASSAQSQTAREELEAFKNELKTTVADAQSQIDTAIASVNEQIAAAVENAQNEIVSAEEKAAEVEAAATEREALAKKKADLAALSSAVDGGGDLSALISGMDDVPAVIAENAEAGIPTMDVLQRQFPDAARVALGSVQTIPEDASAGQKLTAFLKRQTNARSVAPKDGDDPDAVLSRAESLLGKGDLSAALSEVEMLPPEAQEAMTGWLTNAKIRQSALEAVDALSQKLN